MWTLSRTVMFDAAHHLPHHDGKCRRPHGHTYTLHVQVAGATLHTSGPKQGMLVDFGDIDAAVRPLVGALLDHYDLNVTTQLESPTSELLAQWVYVRLKGALPGLVAVEIHETPSSGCRYEETT